jgi:MYXO-CTERM domain-containing protein
VGHDGERVGRHHGLRHHRLTNQGDNARYRVWDADVGDGWVDLAIDVAFGDWTAFEMELAATSFVYTIDGVVVYTDTTTGGSTGFREVIMQAYNFGDPSLGGVTPVNYTAHWSNSQVPEPGSVAVALLTLGGLGALRIRRRRHER